MRFGRSVGLAEEVLDEELDLAYLLGWQVPTHVRYERLHQTRFTLLVARSHPLASAGTVTAVQVARAGLITAPLDDVEWVHYGQVLREIDLVLSDTTLDNDGIQARFLAAAAGMGVVGVFRLAYADDDVGDTLTALRMDRPMPSVEALPCQQALRRPECRPAGPRGLDQTRCCRARMTATVRLSSGISPPRCVARG